MLRIRVRVSIRVKIKVTVSRSILPYCWSADLVHSPHFTCGPECQMARMLITQILGLWVGAGLPNKNTAGMTNTLNATCVICVNVVL